MTNKITLNQLQLAWSIDETIFLSAYEKLLLWKIDDLDENSKFLLLKFALIFINRWNTEVEKFWYSIILAYSNLFSDYKPLYDISINKNYIPISKFIENKFWNLFNNNSFYYNYILAFEENFKKWDIYLSEWQKTLNIFSEKQKDFIVVAPTSYGKSEMIITKIKENIDSSICIIVPSKALLNQFKSKINNDLDILKSNRKIITHPDMLKDINWKNIYILTQERLLRLLQNYPDLTIDILMIDEAHNILKGDERASLLAQVLLILKKRNKNVIFNYFTPFLSNPSNLKLLYNEVIANRKVNEFLKIEKFKYIDLYNTWYYAYDQFLNKFFKLSDKKYNDDIQFIKDNEASKNIIYLNKPRDIEKVALKIKSENINLNEKIIKVNKALGDFLDEDYNLIKTIENGVLYHHWWMPELVRMYVENMFSEDKNFKYIITSSTLLEWINIPAEKIFILTPKIWRRNFTASEFKNLIWRVCRFSEVFNNETGSLNMLEPDIYIVKWEYSQKDFNVNNFLIKRVRENKELNDIIDNPLIKRNNDNLELSEKEEKKLKFNLEFLENIEEGVSDLEESKYVNSEIAKLCFKNNVYDFDIFKNEAQLIKNFENHKWTNLITWSNELIELIYGIFINNLDLEKFIWNDWSANFKRIDNESARKFYSMFISWYSSWKPYKVMISKMLKYWNNPETDDFIYVWKRWWEIKRDPENDIIPLYINLAEKNKSEKTNLAILRIKEELDFIEYDLMKYVEILNDLWFLEQNFYNKIKYWTDDSKIIELLKDWFSFELSRLITDITYKKYVNISYDSINIEEWIIPEMKKNCENDILIFEIGFHINKS